jgi:hypothetical protein
MASDDKVELARRLYVEQGRAIPDIAVSLDAAIFVLQAHCTKDDWASQRQQFLARKKTVDANDVLAQHSEKARKLQLMIDEMVVQLEDKTLSRGERAEIKDRVETLKMVAEMQDIAIDIARKVHGIKSTAPSAQPDAGEEVGIRYIVRRERAVKQALG